MDPHLIEQIEELAAVDGVEPVSEVQAWWIGHRLIAQVRLLVSGSMGVMEAHTVAEVALHHLLHGVPKMSDAIVHVDPAGSHIDAHHLTAHHPSTATYVPVEGSLLGASSRPPLTSRSRR